MTICPECNGTGVVNLPPTPKDANPMVGCKRCAGSGKVETPIGDPPKDQ